MRRMIISMALLVLVGGPVAFAQNSGSGGSSTVTKNQPQPGRDAPVGHRQPRADQMPSEKNLGNPNDPINQEDAALDRKIRSICRGC